MKLWWTCPNCGSEVDFTEQMDSCFDPESGEACFEVDETGGIIFHTIFCPKCNASWVMSIDGMSKSEVRKEYQ